MREKTPPEASCPVCAGRAVFGVQNPFRPFCSKRCKLIDLGAWAEERYRIAGSAAQHAPPEDDDPGQS
ncbi:MAG: DNA gyrase inhibitor YacG [Betaproteobacteria bacterium]|nr:DNA gyrase inhibitor YacG [Betaproteobacteria bacterium]